MPLVSHMQVRRRGKEKKKKKRYHSADSSAEHVSDSASDSDTGSSRGHLSIRVSIIFYFIFYYSPFHWISHRVLGRTNLAKETGTLGCGRLCLGSRDCWRRGLGDPRRDRGGRGRTGLLRGRGRGAAGRGRTGGATRTSHFE